MSESYILTYDWDKLSNKTRNIIRKTKNQLKIRTGTLEELRMLHWNPTYLPLKQPTNMQIHVATYNNIPVSAIATTHNQDTITYNYSGNHKIYKHLNGNTHLLWHIAEQNKDKKIILGPASKKQPEISSYKKHLSTETIMVPLRRKTLKDKLNYRVTKWLPNKINNLLTTNNYTIIHYHEITPQTLEKHIKYLEKHYTISHLDTLNEHLTKDYPIPRNTLYITIDDGWISNYELLPVIKNTMTPITIYIATGYIDTDNNPKTKTPTENLRMLTLEQLNQLSEYCNIQSHSVSHHSFKQLTETEAINELTQSKKWIESLTHHPVYSFAYPYNQPNHIDLIKKTGYTFARSGDRIINPHHNKNTLQHSIGIKPNDTVNKLSTRLMKAEIKTVIRSIQNGY